MNLHNYVVEAVYGFSWRRSTAASTMFGHTFNLEHSYFLHLRKTAHHFHPSTISIAIGDINEDNGSDSVTRRGLHWGDLDFSVSFVHIWVHIMYLKSHSHNWKSHAPTTICYKQTRKPPSVARHWRYKMWWERRGKYLKWQF
jgi:hypothetical protein